jgi:hypothetical protein
MYSTQERPPRPSNLRSVRGPAEIAMKKMLPWRPAVEREAENSRYFGLPNTRRRREVKVKCDYVSHPQLQLRFRRVLRVLLVSAAMLLTVIAAPQPPIARAQTSLSGAAIRLAAGRLSSGTRWTVAAFSGGAAVRPCVLIRLSPLSSDIEDSEESDVRCQRPSLGNLDAFSLVDEFSDPKTTLLAIVMPPKAHSAWLYFNGQLKDRAVTFRQISESKATKSGLAPFGYAALAFSGDSCLSRLVLKDRDGKVLNAGERMHCRG